MKLAAIYNVWDGVELLHGSMKSVESRVDVFIVVFQRKSNFGEPWDPWPFFQGIPGKEMIFVEYNPSTEPSAAPGQHERNKRNIGLDIAKQHQCSHFLHMDCDEYYLDFDKMVDVYLESKNDSSVCNIYTYFRKPTLRLATHDNYFVPFIHQLKPSTKAGEISFSKYGFYVDPTRTISNCMDQPIVIGDMHHFSWIRKNIERKMNNSTARNNIAKSNLYKDYLNAKEGDYLIDYKQPLISVDDHFGIAEMLK